MTLNHLNQVILRTIHSAIPADQKQSFENFQRQMDEACLKFQGNREQSISFDEMDDGERFQLHHHSIVRAVFILFGRQHPMTSLKHLHLVVEAIEHLTEPSR